MGNNQFIDELRKRWRDELPDPQWYIHLEADIRRYFFAKPEIEFEKRVRWALYDLLAAALEVGGVGLGETGTDWDSDRKPINSVVVHHSGTEPEVSLSRLSAMGLIRLYAPVYMNQEAYPEVYGKPMHSHHWEKGRQVFYAYHWLIRPDGTSERLLDDTQIGWHAGSWQINCTSVGVCLAGNYGRHMPTTLALTQLQTLISGIYPGITVLTHNAVNKHADCPGPWANTVDLFAKK